MLIVCHDRHVQRAYKHSHADVRAAVSVAVGAKPHSCLSH